MTIKITKELKTVDSQLIEYLITIPNHNNDSDTIIITINEKYIDVYEIIKKDKNICIDFKDIKYTNYIIEGLLYFGNEKILENILELIFHLAEAICLFVGQKKLLKNITNLYLHG